MNRIYYLNNHGSKWVFRPNPLMAIKHNAFSKEEKIIKRKAMYYSSFGNFAVIHYKYKGIKYTSTEFTDVHNIHNL